MVYKQTSQKILIFIILITIFITIVSGWDYFTYWFPIPFLAAFLYIVRKSNKNNAKLSNLTFLYCIDMLFFDPKDYLYEPDYYNWKDVNEPDY